MHHTLKKTGYIKYIHKHFSCFITVTYEIAGIMLKIELYHSKHNFDSLYE